MLSETFKQVDPPAESMMPADLPADLEEDIGALARRAFEVLGLRDYARFDLRLTQSGTPFFLEANVTPSLEMGEAFARSAQVGRVGLSCAHRTPPLLSPESL